MFATFCRRHFVWVSTILLVSCVSTVTVGPDATEKQILYSAQLAFNNDRYDEALQYYAILRERFGSNPVVDITTSYEIAFVHYTMKSYDKARAQFLSIKNRYETDADRDLYPYWPLILANTLLEKMMNTK